jgi:hypothetical protein
VQTGNSKLTLEVLFHTIVGYWGEAGGTNGGDLRNGAQVADAIPLAVCL